MTGLRTFTVQSGIVEQSPPQVIANQRKPHKLLRRVPRKRRVAMIELTHWGFGAVGGTLFGLLPESVRRRLWAGPVYGVLIWLGFELGVTILLARGARQPPCTIRRGSAKEVIHATPGRDVICAGDGNDIVYGLGGGDIIHGEGGNDVVYAGGGEDRVFGGSGGDVLKGDGGEDRLVGGLDRDILRGADGDDSLVARDGRVGNDVSYGGRGPDSCASDPRDIERSC